MYLFVCVAYALWRLKISVLGSIYRGRGNKRRLEKHKRKKPENTYSTVQWKALCYAELKFDSENAKRNHYGSIRCIRKENE